MPGNVVLNISIGLKVLRSSHRTSRVLDFRVHSARRLTDMHSLISAIIGPVELSNLTAFLLRRLNKIVVNYWTCNVWEVDQFHAITILVIILGSVIFTILLSVLVLCFCHRKDIHPTTKVIFTFLSNDIASESRSFDRKQTLHTFRTTNESFVIIIFTEKVHAIFRRLFRLISF